MFFILITISIIVLTSGLEPAAKLELGDENVRAVFSEYLSQIPDIKEQFVIDQRLSRAISHYFKGKISPFPLYKVSVSIDRNPVKIPWSLGGKNIIKVRKPVAHQLKHNNNHKQYIYIRNEDPASTTLTKKLVENKSKTRTATANKGNKPQKKQPKKNQKKTSGNKKPIEEKDKTTLTLNRNLNTTSRSPKNLVEEEGKTIADPNTNVKPNYFLAINEDSKSNASIFSPTTVDSYENTTFDSTINKNTKINTTL